MDELEGMESICIDKSCDSVKLAAPNSSVVVNNSPPLLSPTTEHVIDPVTDLIKLKNEVEQFKEELKFEYGETVFQALYLNEYSDDLLTNGFNKDSKQLVRWKMEFNVNELFGSNNATVVNFKKNKEDLKSLERQLKADYGAYSSNIISKQNRYNILDNGLTDKIKDEIIYSVENSVLKLSTNEIISILSNRATENVKSETINQAKSTADRAASLRTVAEERQRELSQDVEWVNRDMHDKSLAAWTRPFDPNAQDEAQISRTFARNVEVNEVQARQIIDDARVHEIATQEAYVSAQLRGANNGKMRAEMIARQEEDINAVFDEANHARASFANYYTSKVRHKSLLVMYCNAALMERTARKKYGVQVMAAALDDVKVGRKHAYEDWKNRVACDTLVVLETRALKVASITPGNVTPKSATLLKKKHLWNHCRAKSILKSDRKAFLKAWPAGEGDLAVLSPSAKTTRSSSHFRMSSLSRMSLFRFSTTEGGDSSGSDDLSDEGDWI